MASLGMRLRTRRRCAERPMDRCRVRPAAADARSTSSTTGAHARRTAARAASTPGIMTAWRFSGIGIAVSVIGAPLGVGFLVCLCDPGRGTRRPGWSVVPAVVLPGLGGVGEAGFGVLALPPEQDVAALVGVARGDGGVVVAGRGEFVLGKGHRCSSLCHGA